jgi:non-heme chloroperoxidase
MSESTYPTTAEQVERSNESGSTPVVFVHGLWLLPSSWDRWATLFEEAGYTALTPGWPDDPATVEEAKAKPEVFANKTVGQVADHFAEIIGTLKNKPTVAALPGSSREPEPLDRGEGRHEESQPGMDRS